MKTFLHTSAGPFRGCIPHDVTRAGIVALGWIIAAAAVIAAQTGPAPPDLASISGIITDAKSGKALQYVFVRSERISAKTDAEGKFQLEGIPPGRATVEYEKNGYVASVSTYTLKPGGAFRDAIHLQPTGVISGRLLNGRGAPVIAAEVEALHYEIGDNGRRTLNVEDSGYTDDRGEYRLFNVTPDDYLLSFSSSSWPMFSLSFSTSSGGAAVLYPGVTETQKASMVHVERGGETRLPDTVLSADTHFGTTVFLVTNPGTAEAKDVAFSCCEVSRNTNLRRGRFVSGPFFFDDPIKVQPGGEISFQRLPAPGPSTAGLQWTTAGGAKESLSLTFEANGAGVTIPVPLIATDGQVRVRAILEGADGVTKPLEGIAIALRQPLTGVDGGSFQVAISSRTDTTATRSYGGGGKQWGATETGIDGELLLKGLATGAWDMTGLPALPSGLYLAAARQGSRDALTAGVTATHAANVNEDSVLELRFRSGTAVLRGVLRDKRGKAVHNGFVAALPDGPLAASPLTLLRRSDRSDQNGAFELSGLTPGIYRLYAWSGEEYPSYLGGNYAYLDREYLARFADRSVTVTVPKNGALTIDLKLPEEP